MLETCNIKVDQEIFWLAAILHWSVEHAKKLSDCDLNQLCTRDVIYNMPNFIKMLNIIPASQ